MNFDTKTSPDWNDIGKEGGPGAARAAFDQGFENRSTSSAEEADAKHGTDWRRNIVTAAALQRMIFPPVSFVLPGLIAEGLTILAGRPKLGKSWLALDVCLGVATGHSILGAIMPVAGDVLYCALEDNRRRLHGRINKLLRAEAPERLMLTTSWRKLDDGGAGDISEWCDSVPEPRLIVLDTLAAVRPRKSGADSSLYETDYHALESLRALANERGLAVMVLHHTRKMDAEDPIDTISGSLGLAGCADSVLVMSRSSQGTTLYVRGRDVEEMEFAISFSPETCQWTLLGNATEVQRSDSRRQVLAALTSSEDPLSPDQIATTTGLKRNNVDQLLSRMVEAGEVTRVGRGKYVYSNHRIVQHP
jgi:hypothetical protein